KAVPGNLGLCWPKRLPSWRAHEGWAASRPPPHSTSGLLDVGPLNLVEQVDPDVLDRSRVTRVVPVEVHRDVREVLDEDVIRLLVVLQALLRGRRLVALGDQLVELLVGVTRVVGAGLDGAGREDRRQVVLGGRVV